MCAPVYAAYADACYLAYADACYIYRYGGIYPHGGPLFCVRQFGCGEELQDITADEVCISYTHTHTHTHRLEQYRQNGGNASALL